MIIDYFLFLYTFSRSRAPCERERSFRKVLNLEMLEMLSFTSNRILNRLLFGTTEDFTAVNGETESGDTSTQSLDFE